MTTDSGFPAVHERIPLIATLRAQVVWVGAMAIAFLYAAVWRPLMALRQRGRTSTRKGDRRLTWLSGAASTLNLMFLVGFPLALFGRIEGGLPEFVYGVPPLARGFLFVPPLSAVLSVASAALLAGLWRDEQLSGIGRMSHALVLFALFAFLVFVWFWRLTP